MYGAENGDNGANQFNDNTVAELREQLHKAVSYVRQLTTDKRVLIEVGNRLRAELLRNGNCITAFGHSIPAALFHYLQFLNLNFC